MVYNNYKKQKLLSIKRDGQNAMKFRGKMSLAAESGLSGGGGISWSSAWKMHGRSGLSWSAGRGGKAQGICRRPPGVESVVAQRVCKRN